MKKTILLTVLLSTTSVTAPARATAPSPVLSSPTREQIATVCIHNQAETLPVPFKDVSPTDWAFKAVMTMHYCGAYRQAAPPALFQSTPTKL